MYESERTVGMFKKKPAVETEMDNYKVTSKHHTPMILRTL